MVSTKGFLMPHDHTKRLVRPHADYSRECIYFVPKRGFLTMSALRRTAPGLACAVVLALSLSACQAGPAEDEVAEVEAPTEDTGAQDEAPEQLVFVLPTVCQDIFPAEVLDELVTGDIDLLRGPGSGSTDTVYPEGASPQEERGGISCLFGNPDETQTFTVSVAPMTQASRAEVIDGLLAQQLNPGQTPDGVLTYWIQGDADTVPAIYNALYPDAWYEVLVFPGGRLAYERSVSLVADMRDHTTVAG